MSNIPANLQFIHIGQNFPTNSAQYAISGDYIYERTPFREGDGYWVRRAHWQKLVETASVESQPLGIWEELGRVDT